MLLPYLVLLFQYLTIGQNLNINQLHNSPEQSPPKIRATVFSD